ncbi:uncharacterized protein N7473_013230 [Penicillium subrubescens]|uniref:uncharacterized protein n=1 Tax=Penicillium subrubescens TaxID=1316194 RepID=UPI0025455D97|nr:uncharacterized protein N7473_013230 [Penicillium subrubescens]KAJ5873671.1 hypothetical protein N7473_013230 [Penicillium subrubescens]
MYFDLVPKYNIEKLSSPPQSVDPEQRERIRQLLAQTTHGADAQDNVEFQREV